MSIPLPVFIAIPLVTAFVLPVFGKKGKDAATVLANLATISLLVLAVASIGQSAVYEIGKWSIPLGINLVLDGLSSLMLLAIGVAIVVATVVDVTDQQPSESWYFAFFGMGFLANKYLLWILNKGITRIGGKKLGGMPLTRISGINFWIERRLREGGIENVQNLATSDVINLAVKTQYNVRTLLDWVDQAVLLDRLDEKALHLQENCLISGAIDMAWASPENSGGDAKTAKAIADAIKVEPHFVALLMDSLFEDAYVRILWTLWQTKFDKR